MTLLSYEKKLYKDNITLIAGVDEVGRGPLIGPVVAAAVILPVNYQLAGLTDSKKLTEKKRKEYYEVILKDAIAVGVAQTDAKTIDEINILEASKLAMVKAVNNLKVKPEYLLIDGNQKIDTKIPYETIVKGDSLSLSIAAASVVAKVTRDSMMYELDLAYPEYGFAEHKGYPTKKHLANLEEYGPLGNYRFSFKPLNVMKKGALDERKIKQINIS